MLACHVRDSLPVAALITVFLTGAAWAGDPKFEFGDKAKAELDKVEDVAWDASAQAGVLVTTGNSRATTGSAGVSASRREGNNKLAFDAGGAYARSRIFIASDDNGDGALDAGEIDSITQTTTKAWFAKTRYDRFITEHNSLYVSGVVSADKPAGKQFVGGGQTGYSRQLFKSAGHEVVAEVGYDFSYEDLTVGDPLSIHSGRVFGGYKGTLSADTSLASSLEFLANFNELDGAQGTIDPLDDRRTTFVVALTTKLWSDISFRFGFTAKHDSAPAPLPPLSIPYATGFVPLADKLDTKTEATLIVNFL